MLPLDNRCSKFDGECSSYLLQSVLPEHQPAHFASALTCSKLTLQRDCAKVASSLIRTAKMLLVDLPCPRGSIASCLVTKMTTLLFGGRQRHQARTPNAALLSASIASFAVAAGLLAETRKIAAAQEASRKTWPSTFWVHF